jgi:ArsR family transcriptional regulator
MRIHANGDMKSLSSEHVHLIANRARALGDPTRVRILSVLERGEQPVGQIAAAVDTQQSTASKHLQVLFHAGLVQRRRDASEVLYSLTSAELPRVCRYLAARRLERPPARRTHAPVWKVHR